MLRINWGSEEVIMVLHIIDNDMLDTNLLDDDDLVHLNKILTDLIKYDGYYDRFFISDTNFSSTFLENILRIVGYDDSDIENLKIKNEVFNSVYFDEEGDEFELYVGEIDLSDKNEVLNFLKSIVEDKDGVDYSDDLLKSGLRDFIYDNIECEYDSENTPCLYLRSNPDILTHDNIITLLEELDFCSFDIFSFINYGCTLRQALDRMLITREEYNEIMYPYMRTTLCTTIEQYRTYLVNKVSNYKRLDSEGASAEVIVFKALIEGYLSFSEVDGYAEYFNILLDTLLIDQENWGYIIPSDDEIFKYFDSEELIKLVTIIDVDYRQYYAALNGYAFNINQITIDELTYYEYLGILDKIYLEDILESNFDSKTADLSDKAIDIILDKVFNSIEYCLEYFLDELISLFKYLIEVNPDEFQSFKDLLSEELVQVLSTSDIPSDIIKYFV